MKKGYVTALAIAAAFILIAGALVRPKRKPKAAPTGTPAIAQPVPQPTRRGQMRQISDYLAERAVGVSNHVVWLSSAHSSGIRWPDGQILLPAASPALAIATSLPADATVPVRLAGANPSPGWVVVAARNSQNEPISTSGLLGGIAEVQCGSVNVRKLLLNTSLDSEFAGAGVFDLTGDLLGVVVQCGTTWTAVAHESISAFLSKQTSSDSVLWHDLGVRIREASPEERKLLRIGNDGLFVGEMRRGSRAFNMGIRPGDVLQKTGDEKLKRAEDLLSLNDSLTLIRNGRPLVLSVKPSFTLETANAGALLTSVEPETRLWKAGLRAGDRIVRANGVEDPGPGDLNRLFALKKPLWLVYQREDRRVWVMLP